MSYRPITDVWLLTRGKLGGGKKFYGAFLGGFGERARALLGVHINDPVLHVCGGCVRAYPYPNAVGPNDRTLDLDPLTNPDFCQDACDPLPRGSWAAVLADPPYSEADAEHYAPGARKYPPPGTILRRALEGVETGRRVGILHYFPPRPPEGTRYVAEIHIGCGFGNRARVFSVFERGTGTPKSKRRKA